VAATGRAETLRWGEKRAETGVKYVGCDLGKGPIAPRPSLGSA
jgi:hypothetical protein